MIKPFLLLLFVFIFPICAQHGGCHGSPYFGTPNLYPILQGNSNAKLIATVQNGKLYEVTVPNDGGNTTATFKVMHVYGSAYEMGYAQGHLLNNSLPQFMEDAWVYMESQLDSVLSWLPKWLQDAIADLGLDAALDATYYATREYTGNHIYDELQGLADGSGGDYNTIVRVHMIAGLTQGACSMFGAWGTALDPSFSGKLLQLRALDWDMDGPFRDHNQLTVYHPNIGNNFVNVGFSGFIGGLSGASSQKLAISEIGVTFPDPTFGSMSRIGVPFIFLLRDILQFDQYLDDAINRMINARRTCDLILGVGDGKSGSFRGMQYSYSVLNVFDDSNMRPNNQSWHPKLVDTVYWGMDWECPSYNYVLGNLLNQYHGKLNPEVAIRFISAVEQSGDNHIAIYDLSNLVMYLSFGAPHSVGGPEAAYSRQYTQFDLQKLFAEQM